LDALLSHGAMGPPVATTDRGGIKDLRILVMVSEGVDPAGRRHGKGGGAYCLEFGIGRDGSCPLMPMKTPPFLLISFAIATLVSATSLFGAEAPAPTGWPSGVLGDPAKTPENLSAYDLSGNPRAKRHLILTCHLNNEWDRSKGPGGFLNALT